MCTVTGNLTVTDSQQIAKVYYILIITSTKDVVFSLAFVCVPTLISLTLQDLDLSAFLPNSQKLRHNLDETIQECVCYDGPSPYSDIDLILPFVAPLYMGK